MKKKVAIVIGHHAEDQGASHKEANMTEFWYNTELVKHIMSSPCWKSNVGLLQFVWYEKASHKERIAEINSVSPDMAIELHCNAYEEQSGEKEVTGTEVLYWHTSRLGKLAAEMFVGEMAEMLGLKNRGAKERKRNTRGWMFLQGTKCPAVILEPFFIDNSDDLRTGLDNMMNLADVIAMQTVEMLELITKEG